MAAIRTVGIRGAGLAGMSLAEELLRRDPTLKISLFDTRPRLPHPRRTFCFFRGEKEDRDLLISHEWRDVVFRGRSFERRIDVSSSPYSLVRGDEFFGHVLSGLESRGVSFRWCCRDVSVGKQSLQVDGDSLYFDRVVDAAFEPTRSRSILWQSFAGVWVTSRSPVFDPTTALLMDLQRSSRDAAVSFLYVLPTSPHTALVEHTTFSPRPLDPEYHMRICSEWMHRHAPGELAIGDSEHGAIPMGLHTEEIAGVLSVGTCAGAVRPATGYGFRSIRDQANELSQWTLDCPGPSVQPKKRRPWWLDFSDKLFLQALLGAPERGEVLLGSLLERAPSRALVQFLGGKVDLQAALSVWLAVPKLEIVRSLLRV